MSRIRCSVICVALALALPATAYADSGAENFVKKNQSALASLVAKGKSKNNDAKIQKIFDGMIDYEILAKDSLKSYWGERSEAERKAFQCVLKQLVQNAYRKNLNKTANYQVTYRGKSKAKKGFLVKTVAKSKTNPREEPLTIDYVVAKSGGEYLIVDIVTEGSSLVRNYQSQFRRIIKKKGFEELLNRMKKKAKKNGTPVSC